MIWQKVLTGIGPHLKVKTLPRGGVHHPEPVRTLGGRRCSWRAALVSPHTSRRASRSKRHSREGIVKLKIPLILNEAVNIDEEGLLTHEFDELLHERPQSRLRHSWHQVVVQAALPEQGVDAPFGGAGFEMFVEAQSFASGAKQRQKRNRQCIEKP